MVEGKFSPSGTRKFLTGLAKKGGMKAVLAYVGSVVPGIGNIGGFLAGGVVDFIYGDGIKKYIDKVADIFDDNKVYVFDCPKCGNSWARKEDEIENTSNINYSSSNSDEIIFSRVKDIIADKLSVNRNRIFRSSRIAQDLGADSLDTVELIMEMEKEYSVQVSDSEAEKFRTVGDVVTYLANIKSHYSNIEEQSKIAIISGIISSLKEYASSNNKLSLTVEENEYTEELRECLEDGEISRGERRLLEKLRVKLGISESRAAEIEALLMQPQLTEAEQEYFDEYKECLTDGGEISAGERRLLNRLRTKLGISEQRASELEKL